MRSQDKAEHGGPISRLSESSPSIETRAKRKVELLPLSWIVPNFSEHLQIIENHQLQSLIPPPGFYKL